MGSNWNGMAAMAESEGAQGGLEFSVLGSLVVRRAGGSLDLGSYKQRALLALLLVHRNEVLSTDRIIDELWGSEAPTDRKNALHVYLSNLRKVLEPERMKRTEGSVILTRSPGYSIRTAPDAVDADVFLQLVAEGRALLAADPGAASIALGDALARWHGLPFEEFTYEGFAQTEISRLNELRLEAVEDRVDADLARGLARELVGEIESLVGTHPLRERLTGQLMLALYRSGRQAEALRAFQSLQGRLAEELGIDPSLELRRLEEMMVLGDPSLTVRAEALLPGDRAVIGPAVRGYELRELIGEGRLGAAYRAFQPAVGREVAVKVLRADVADDPAFIRGFEDQAQAIARLDHPYIVPLYDFWREPGAAFLVMRLMQGGNLAHRLAAGPLDGPAVGRLAAHVGEALHAAHRLGMVHGDVRPGNLLIDADGDAHLSDFGIALGHGDGDGVRSLAPADPMYAAPERGDGEAVDPSSDGYSLAVVVAQALAGRQSALPELLVGMDPAIADVLVRATAQDPAARYPDVRAFVDALLEALDVDATGTAARESDAVNPYKGLRAFAQSDADDFFGRERAVERLVSRLGAPGRAGRFVAVVGPSGSGKSSLVRAGLLPALRRGGLPGSDRWFAVEMVPGRHPVEELEDALRSIAVRPPASLLEMLSAPDGLSTAVDMILPDDGAQLVLVVDQLEELYTHGDATVADRFMETLAGAVSGPRSRLRVIATLRADFYDRPLLHRTFGELLREGTEVIIPMSAGELEQAVTGPAGRLGVGFDPALVAEIVSDVADRPAALPLLQYTLTELFDQRHRKVVTLDAYRKLGGVLGALVQRAESLYATLDVAGESAARQVFLRLVTVGEGVERDTRRRVLVTELTALGESGEAVQTVLDVFGRHRLLTYDRDLVTRSPSVEISHEALLVAWDRLHGWIEDARNDIRQQRRLAAALAEWTAAGASNDYLLRGGRLGQLAAWAAVTSLAMSEEERGFLEASIDLRDRTAAEEQAREDARVRAVRQSRRRARLLGALAVVAIVVGVLAVFAWTQRQQAAALADEAEQRALAIRLADQAVRQTRSDPQLAVLLALSAADATVGVDALPIPVEEAMHLALQSAGIAYPADVSEIQTAFGPGGVVGYYAMEPTDLALLMAGGLTRRFTTTECASFDIPACPQAGSEVRAELLPSRIHREPSSLVGTSVRLNTAFDPDDFRPEMERFTAETGIGVSIGDLTEPLYDVRTGADRFEPWDVLILAQPGAVRDIDTTSGLSDLGRYLDAETIRAARSTFLYDTWNADGRFVAVPFTVDVKSIVWYARAGFAEDGYTEPDSWEELLALSHRIAEEGGVPWCLGFASGDASGWPGTDWIEGLSLRIAGPQWYDRWVSHDVPFDDAPAVEAAQMLDRLMAGPGYVFPSRSAISTTPFFVGNQLVGEGCWMNYGASYSFGPPGWASAGPSVADLDAFVLPPARAGGSTPLFGGGTAVSAPHDRPEVRAFMAFVAREDFGAALTGSPAFLLADRRFDASLYGPADDPHADLRREFSTAALTALANDEFRFDASDLMPGAIGSFGQDGRRGAFWEGMLDLADERYTAAEVMAHIEEAWLELEAQGS